MRWAEAVPVLLVGALWLVVPGLTAGFAAGLRGLALLGLAPVLSVVVVALASVVSGFLGLRWGPWPVILVGVVVTVAALAVRRLRGRSVVATDPLWTVGLCAAGLVLAALSGLLIFSNGWVSPEAISQTYDAVFHYNALAAIADTGQVSPFFIGTLDAPGSAGRFYPGVWHALASLMQLTPPGTTVLASANLTSALVCLIVWPAGCALLVRQVLGSVPWAGFGVPLLSLSFVVFPWTLFKWGVLWPNMLGLAMVPAALALLLSLAGLATDDVIGSKVAFALLPPVLVACVLTHPSAVASFAVVAAPIVGIAGFRAVKTGWRREYWLIVAAAIVAVPLAAIVFATDRFKVMSETPWPAFETPSQAIGEAVLLATNLNGEAFLQPTRNYSVFLLLAGLTIAGAVRAWSRVTWRWLVAGHVAAVGLFMLAASDDSPMTQSLTGLWYNDSYRLAAMLAVTGVPLAALGLSAIVSAVASRWKVKELVAGLAAVSLFYISTGGGYATPRERTVAGNYHRLPDEVIVVSEIEQEFFKTVGTIVPQGQVVAGNPWNGSSMLYPVAGTRVLFHHIKGHWSDDQLLVAEHLIDAEQRPEVCAAVHRLQVAYLITGGDGFWDWSPESKLYPGLEEPGVRPGFVLATAHGPHKLYRLTACDLGRQNY